MSLAYDPTTQHARSLGNRPMPLAAFEVAELRNHGPRPRSLIGSLYRVALYTFAAIVIGVCLVAARGALAVFGG